MLARLDRIALAPAAIHPGHGRPRPHVTPETLSPHCLACGGAGHLVFHLPGSKGGPSAQACRACGGVATLGIFVVRLVALDARGGVRWAYDFAGADTLCLETAAGRCATAAAWVGAMSRLPSLRREVRVVYLAAGVGPRGRVVLARRAG